MSPNDPSCNKMQTGKDKSGSNTRFFDYDRSRFMNSMETEPESKARLEKLKGTVRKNISKTVNGKQKVEEKVIVIVIGYLQLPNTGSSGKSMASMCVA